MRIILAIILLALMGCGQWVQAPKTFVNSPKLEMEVIVSLLQGRYGATIATGVPLVIDDSFSATYLDMSKTDDKRKLMAEASDHVPTDLIQDFCEKNAEHTKVWPQIQSQLKINLINRAEEDSFFSGGHDQQPDGWEKFYAKYPNSPGIITLSRVGFNRKGDMAMLYMGSQSHWLAGSGQIYVLHRLDGKWVVEPFKFGPSWVS